MCPCQISQLCMVCNFLLTSLFSLDRLVVNLIMLEDEESQTHLEPLERESAEEWRTGTGK